MENGAKIHTIKNGQLADTENSWAENGHVTGGIVGEIASKTDGKMTSRISRLVGEDMKSEVAILIPTLNEENGIGQTIDDVLTFVPDCRIYVVDGHSSDTTVDIAIDRGATVISTDKGKGRAVRIALPCLLSIPHHKYLVMLDGDNTYPAKHIPEILRELRDGAAAAMGFRIIRENGAMTRANIVGNWGLSMLASLLYGITAKDVCSGLWGFRCSALREFALTSNEFTLEADLLGNTMRNGFRFSQIPIEYRARSDIRESKLRIWDGFKIAGFLARGRLRQ